MGGGRARTSQPACHWLDWRRIKLDEGDFLRTSDYRCDETGRSRSREEFDGCLRRGLLAILQKMMAGWLLTDSVVGDDRSDCCWSWR